MSDRESRKKDLLKELGDVRSLLDDAETPSPLSPAAPGTIDRERIRKLASERSNPFLGTSRPPTPRDTPASAAAPSTAERPTLSRAAIDTVIDTVIDELVADALPKLENALRLKLRAALRKKL